MKAGNIIGTIKADIKLVNPTDLALVDEKKIGEDAVRRINITALVDTGAYMLCINDSISRHLGLRHMTYQKLELADGSVVEAEVVGPVIVNFKNRTTACRALVLPGNAQPLLGSIPMEDMDLIIIPETRTLEINPDSPNIASSTAK